MWAAVTDVTFRRCALHRHGAALQWRHRWWGTTWRLHTGPITTLNATTSASPGPAASRGARRSSATACAPYSWPSRSSSPRSPRSSAPVLVEEVFSYLGLGQVAVTAGLGETWPCSPASPSRRRFVHRNHMRTSPTARRGLACARCVGRRRSLMTSMRFLPTNPVSLAPRRLRLPNVAVPSRSPWAALLLAAVVGWSPWRPAQATDFAAKSLPSLRNRLAPTGCGGHDMLLRTLAGLPPACSWVFMAAVASSLIASCWRLAAALGLCWADHASAGSSTMRASQS